MAGKSNDRPQPGVAHGLVIDMHRPPGQPVCTHECLLIARRRQHNRVARPRQPDAQGNHGANVAVRTDGNACDAHDPQLLRAEG
jgi:hypothetical protein